MLRACVCVCTCVTQAQNIIAAVCVKHHCSELCLFCVAVRLASPVVTISRKCCSVKCCRVSSQMIFDGFCSLCAVESDYTHQVFPWESAPGLMGSSVATVCRHVCVLRSALDFFRDVMFFRRNGFTAIFHGISRGRLIRFSFPLIYWCVCMCEWCLFRIRAHILPVCAVRFLFCLCDFIRILWRYRNDIITFS